MEKFLNNGLPIFGKEKKNNDSFVEQKEKEKAALLKEIEILEMVIEKRRNSKLKTKIIEDEKHLFLNFTNAEMEVDQINIREEDRNSDGRLLASNGKESKLPNELYWKIVRTPSFKKWFGDWQDNPKFASKVVDSETNEPLVVYHGTPNIVGVEGIKPKRSSGLIFFTAYPEIAKHFAGTHRESFQEEQETDFLNKNDIYFSTFLNIKNPISVERHEEIIAMFDDDLLSYKKKLYKKYPLINLARSTKDLLELGHDGIIQDTEIDISDKDTSSFEGNQFVVFSPDQIFYMPSDKNFGKKV